MEEFVEITEQEYKEVFEWLYEKENIELIKELDISMAHSYNEPYIFYTKEIQDIFNTKAMQRLQRVTHLGTSILDNQSAYHTRLEHSKGAYRRAIEFVALKYKEKDWKEYIEKNNLKPYLIDIVIFMAVHDVGHAILSHAIESVIGDKECNHELIGNKIVTENKELSEAIKKAKGINKTNEKHEELQLLCEGNVDFDREDFIIRDRLYLDEPYEKGIIDKINKECHLRNVQINGENKNVYAFSENVVEDIKKFLTIRCSMYKKEYYHLSREMLDFLTSYIAQKIVNEDIDTARRLKQYLNQFVGKNINEIDVDKYIEGTDLLWYNELINILKNSEDEKLKQIVAIAIPENEALINMAINMLDPKNTDKSKYNEEEKRYINNVKSLIEEKQQDTELAQLLKKAKTKYVAINVKDEAELENLTDNIEKILGTREIPGLGIIKRKFVKYKPHEPVYIERKNGEICTLDKYEEAGDLSTSYGYGIYLVGPILEAEGIQKDKVDQAIELIKQNELGQTIAKTTHNRMRLFKIENQENMDWFDER